MVLKEYAHRPPNILRTWDVGRALLSFFANSQGSSTTVRITARFSGFENNVTHSWMEWPTKGVEENVLLDRIAKDLTGSGQWSPQNAGASQFSDSDAQIPERIFGSTGGSLLGLASNASGAVDLPAASAPVAVRYSLDPPAQ